MSDLPDAERLKTSQLPNRATKLVGEMAKLTFRRVVTVLHRYYAVACLPVIGGVLFLFFAFTTAFGIF